MRDSPLLSATATAEDYSASTSDVPRSPLLVIHPPPVSPDKSPAESVGLSADSDDEADVADGMQGGHRLGLDIPLSPLRVVYSPNVSRSASIRKPRRSSVDSDFQVPLTEDMQPSLQDESSAVQPISRVSSSSVGHAHPRRRHSSISPNDEDRFAASDAITRNRISTATNSEAVAAPSLVMTASGRPSENRSPTRTELGPQEEQYPPVFRAFPAKKWIDPITIAKVSLAIVTCSVLGNFIYT